MRLPLETQTLYAEALERARLAEMHRDFGHLPGSFGLKTLPRGAFWYFRTSGGGRGRREFYVGPDDEATRALIAVHGKQKAEGEDLRTQLGRMAAMLASGGCMTLDAPSFKVVEALAQGGLFRLGGVLVGTHAFVTLGNLLGIRWETALKTQDLDFAAFRTLEIAAAQKESADIWGTLDALNMGFLPTPGLNPRAPHTSYHIRGRELKVDFLTTASRRGPFTPVFLPRFQAAALPMPYMDYLLEGGVEALAVSANAAVLANVPHPARYGLHKLVVAGERPLVAQTKAAKDAVQASELLSWFLEMRPADLEIACKALIKKNMIKAATASAERYLGQSDRITQYLRERH